MTFDTNVEDYPTEVHIDWYRDNNIIASEDYFPDRANYSFIQEVIAYNKVVIKFKSMNKPYRYLRIFDIEDGVTREFYNDEITNLQILEETSLRTENLSINTMDLELKTKNEIGVLFQRTLPLKLYRDESLIGAFFIEAYEKESKGNYSVTSTDYIGLLDHEDYKGGMFYNKKVGSIVADILGEMPYVIDASLSNRTVTGYLAIQKKREALQKLIFACGGIIDCSRSESIEIKPLKEQIISTIGKDKVVSIKEITESITTSIELVEHRYNPQSEAETIFEDTISGETTINFGSPYTSLSITGGTIISSGTNYAVITGEGQVLLTGIGYDDITTTKSKNNPLTVTTDIRKTKKYNSTLICNEINLIDKLEFINKKLKVNFNLSNKEKVGDKINILGQTARIISLDYSLNTPNIYATAEMEVC